MGLKMALPNINELIGAGVTEASFKTALQQFLENVVGVEALNQNFWFNPKKIVAGDDFNSITKQGVYYHWGSNLTNIQVTNGPLYVSNNLAFGIMVVTNANPATPSTVNASVTQTFYPLNDGYRPFYRKYLQTSTWGSWDNLVTGSTQYTQLTAITTGQDALSLPVGRYNIPSIAIGDSMLNMPTMPYKFGRIEVDYNATTGYKTIAIIPYGRDSNFYRNKQYELGVWSGWKIFKDYDAFKAESDALYASKTALSLAVASALNNVTQDKYFGKQYTSAETTGTVVYSAAYYAGYNNVAGSGGANFNTVKARIWNPDGGDVQYRVYHSGKVYVVGNGNMVVQANVNSPDYSGVCKFFPQADTGAAQEIILDQVIAIPASSPFVIVFRDADIRTLRIAHVSAASGNLEARGFNLIAAAGEWGDTLISVGSPPTYTQAGFQLLLKLPSSGGSSPVVYTPELVLPPKVYALEGLQSNVFLEHTLAVDHLLYDYDITCNKGIHQNRGWRWTPSSDDVAGNYALSLMCLDKQTGAQLATASTQVVLVNKNANAGVTKKVQVIGDSLVSAGSITQGLLNNASTDVMPITLIGTRGTGLNKHEGRGGWTINDYTTVGRTYFLFTVSGITTTPAINATAYTYGSGEFTVQEANITGGNGTLLCSYTGTAPTNGATGTLTKSNASAGDATIAFSNVQSHSGNPFWNGTTVNYQNYLTVNSLAAPDVVIIQLGINDTFSMTSDQAVIDFCATAFPKLDVLINSILAVNASIKVALSAPPSYASQDAFGNNYQCGQTSRRAKRNITTYNKQLFAYYKDKEVSRIYVISGGLNVDAENNFPESAVSVNSRNTKTVIKQTNAVHPDTSGYYQESDVLTAFIKSLT